MNGAARAPKLALQRAGVSNCEGCRVKMVLKFKAERILCDQGHMQSHTRGAICTIDA